MNPAKITRAPRTKGKLSPRLNAATVRTQTAVEHLAAGKKIVVTDSSNRENEGDLFVLAETITTQQVNFMMRQCCGLLCAAMSSQRLDELHVPMMITRHADETSLFESYGQETAFTVSVDHHSSHTGISADERARTLRALADPVSVPSDFLRPGHVFPLRAASSIFLRCGHTEAAVTLAKLAAHHPVVAICEIINPDGSMARRDDLIRFTSEHKLAMISIQDLILSCLEQGGWLTPHEARCLGTLNGVGMWQAEVFSLAEFLPLKTGASDYHLLILYDTHKYENQGDATSKMSYELTWLTQNPDAANAQKIAQPQRIAFALCHGDKIDAHFLADNKAEEAFSFKTLARWLGTLGIHDVSSQLAQTYPDDWGDRLPAFLMGALIGREIIRDHDLLSLVTENNSDHILHLAKGLRRVGLQLLAP